MKKLIFLFSFLMLIATVQAQSFLYHPTASATLKGYLSSTDWTTFNNKFTLPSFTSGSVMFSNGATLVQDNANFFWDDTNNRLGIGTTSPTTELQVVSTSASDPRGFMTSQYSTDNLAARMHYRKSRGTFGSPSTIVVGDMLGRTRYSGYDGTSFLQMASIDVGTSGTIGTGRIPTYMTFSTATDAATSVLTERMRITASGLITLQGITSAFPALKRSGTGLEIRLADDSAYAPLTCSTLNTSSTITSSSTIIASGGNSTINTQGTNSGTSGTNNAFDVLKNFSPTSGTGIFNAFSYTGTINQTGGASGKSRGIHINPTITAAADFIAIEVARGKSIFAGRLETGMGANVASSGTLTLGDDGNLFHITGTTAITAITTTNWQAGSEITLIFDSTASITAGANMLLSGAANFNATANDVIKLVWDGTSWFEVARSVN